MPPQTPALSYAEIEERLANRPQPFVLADGREAAYLYRAQNGRGHWHIMVPLPSSFVHEITQEEARRLAHWFADANAFIRWAEAEMLAEADRCQNWNQFELSKLSSHPLVRKHDA
jgi:hypothetical protein